MLGMNQDILNKAAIFDIQYEIANLRKTYPQQIAKLDRAAAQKHIEAIKNYQPQLQQQSVDMTKSVLEETLASQPSLLSEVKNLKETVLHEQLKSFRNSGS